MGPNTPISQLNTWSCPNKHTTNNVRGGLVCGLTSKVETAMVWCLPWCDVVLWCAAGENKNLTLSPAMNQPIRWPIRPNEVFLWSDKKINVQYTDFNKCLYGRESRMMSRRYIVYRDVYNLYMTSICCTLLCYGLLSLPVSLLSTRVRAQAVLNYVRRNDGLPSLRPPHSIPKEKHQPHTAQMAELAVGPGKDFSDGSTAV